jgi:glycerophosphoryl diester phosphodiesterase
MAAFTLAVELGADLIEADVRRAGDGRLVLLHDAHVDRTTDGHGLISGFSFAELSRLDAGSWFDPRFAGERIPTLEEIFELADGADIGLCLEAKGSSRAEHASVATEVAREIRRRQRLDVDVLASFDHPCLALATAEVPGLRCAPDRLPERGPVDGEALVEQATAIGATIIQVHHADLTDAAVDLAHSSGIAVWAWPPESTHEIEQAAGMGVDAVMGDDVGLIRSTI